MFFNHSFITILTMLRKKCNYKLRRTIRNDREIDMNKIKKLYNYKWSKGWKFFFKKREYHLLVL